MTEMPHNYSTYSNHGCRCVDCRASAVEWNFGARLRREHAMREGLVSPPHGSVSTYYNYRCRCDECKAAMAAGARVRRRERAVS